MTAVPREYQRFVTGQGCYVDDVRLPGALHVTFVRSMLACGELGAIDLQAARAIEGVVAVLVGNDVAHLGALPVNPVLPNMTVPGYPVLALRQVGAVGQPVAAIVAHSVQAGADAADLIQFDIEARAPRMFSPRAPELAGDELALSKTWSWGDQSARAAEVAHRVQASIDHPRLAPCSLEPRGIAARFEPTTGGLTIWLSTQTPHRARQHLAAMLDLDEELIRVIAPDVGGAFGMKASLYPEEVLVAWAAIELKRSVRWTSSRSEDLLTASHGRGATTCGTLAVSSAGEFLSLTADIVCPLGHWLPNSAAVPAWNAARILPGPYRIAAGHVATRGFLTNTAPVGIYRGAGRPEAAALLERLVELAARATGLDPLEIRRRNLIEASAMPYQGPTGIVIDSGRYHEALSVLQTHADYDGLMQSVLHRREGGELVGIGTAFYVEPCGQGWESARVDIDPAGQVTAATGGSTQGHSRETALAGIVAGVLDIDSTSVTVLCGDTARCPAGIGALASRSTAIGGSAMLQAAQAAKQTRAALLARGAPVVVSEQVNYEAAAEAWGYGVYLAVVSIDRETGEVRCEKIFLVDDIGRIIDAKLVQDQIVGGIAQGLGEALLEQVIYDDSGQLLTGSLMDYALPRATDMPEISIKTMQTLSPANLLGAKGVGEAGTIATPAAVMNAVHDALADFELGDIAMPFTSPRIWQAMQPAQAKDVRP